MGVQPSADEETLHRAFRRLSKDLHPDTTMLPFEEAAWKFQYLCEAYELLTDKKRREEYDAGLSLDSYSHEEEPDSFIGNSKEFSLKADPVGIRRPFSGGELFSLVLLGVAFALSLLLGLVVAFSQGRDLFVRPTWLDLETAISDRTQLQIGGVYPYVEPGEKYDSTDF